MNRKSILVALSLRLSICYVTAGNAILNVNLTITDQHGDQISANISGFAIYRNSGQSWYL